MPYRISAAKDIQNNTIDQESKIFSKDSLDKLVIITILIVWIIVSLSMGSLMAIANSLS